MVCYIYSQEYYWEFSSECFVYILELTYLRLENEFVKVPGIFSFCFSRVIFCSWDKYLKVVLKVMNI